MEQNLNLYQVFYEVAGCRNFSLAAKKLYITQPAVSKAISRLEETLETTLFHRSSRGVRLTRAPLPSRGAGLSYPEIRRRAAEAFRLRLGAPSLHRGEHHAL